MNFREEAQAMEQEIIQTRRYLHEYPELSFEEKHTSDYLENALRELGLTPHRYPDYYGVWADIKGGEGRTVLLRADIDALPIPEETNLPYASKTPGVMHACGHDNHAAMLLAAAKMLVRHKDELKGTVRILFQAAEESCHGAEYYVQHGLLDDVDAVYGSHVWATLDSPYINVESGPRMSSCDNFTITVRGKAAHGATPQKGADAIVAAAAIVLQVQSIVSRRTDPRDSLTVTIGEIEGGARFNVIPELVTMKGTVRTHSKEVRGRVEGLLRDIVEGTARAHGAQAELTYDYYPDVLINDETLSEIARQSVIKLYGEEALKPQPLEMGSEDFSYFLEKAPGVYAYIGIRSEEKGITFPNHNSHFLADESALKRGAALYAQFAYDYLEQEERHGR